MAGQAPLRVACVGAGYFSQFHYESWGRMPRVTPIGACDHDLAKAKTTGWPAFDDLQAMLDEGTPDILDVILPPVAQAEAVRAGLAKGVRAIICQKPFCRDMNEARSLTRDAQEAGIPLIIHENFRFQPWYRAIKGLLSDGRLGEVHQIRFALRPGDGQGPRAYLDRQPYFQTMPRLLIHETGVHWIDTFRYLFGAPQAVYADLRRRNPVIAGEDAGHVILDMPDGVQAVFDGNRHIDHAADNPRRTMGEAWIEGTSATLRLTGDGALWLRGHGVMDETMVLAPDCSPNFGGDCVHALNTHVVTGLLEGGAFENEAEEYLDVLGIEAAIYRSSEEGRKITLYSGSDTS